MRHLAPALLCAFALAACDPAPKAEPSAKTDAPAEGATTQGATTQGAATSGLAPSDKNGETSALSGKKDYDPAKSAASSRSFRQLLNDGRAKVKAGDHAAGVSLYIEALAIDPNHARLLSELGWANFKLNELDEAEEFTRSSIAHSRDDKVRGASLYNLGRIHEARGDSDEAATAYSNSLTVRPGNAIVQKRLDALESGGAAVADPNATCRFGKQDSKTPKPNPSEVCQAYLGEIGEAMAASAGGVDTNCLDSDNEGAPTAKPGGVDVVTFRYEVVQDEMIVDVVAVLREDGWWTHEFNQYGRLGNSYNGNDSAFEELKVDDLDKLGDPDLIMTYHFSSYDGDYGENTVELYDEVSKTLLDPHADTPELLGFFLTKRHQSFGAWLEEDDLPKSEDEVYVDQASKLSYEWEAVVVEDVPGKEPATPAARFMLAEIPNRCYHSVPQVY